MKQEEAHVGMSELTALQSILNLQAGGRPKSELI